MSNNKKFQTQAEIYKTLLNGKKITAEIIKPAKYLHLVNGLVVDENGSYDPYTFHVEDTWSLYQRDAAQAGVWGCSW